MDTVRWFRKIAKELLKEFRAGDASAASRIRRRTRSMKRVHIQKVQHVVAKEAGFTHWEDLLNATDERRQKAIESFDS
jgi:hypothetical protein